MKKVDVPLLTGDMLAAAKAAAGDRWPVLEQFAEIELRALATKLADIQNLLATRAIGAERAQEMLYLQQTVARATLLSIKGLGMLTAEAVLKSVTHSIAADVNRMVGFKLIVTHDAPPAPEPATPDFKAGRDL
jgi:hypothetical protein